MFVTEPHFHAPSQFFPPAATACVIKRVIWMGDGRGERKIGAVKRRTTNWRLGNVLLPQLGLSSGARGGNEHKLR